MRYLYEGKGRRLVPNIIYSPSPIILIQMRFSGWLKMIICTRKRPFTSERYTLTKV